MTEHPVGNFIQSLLDDQASWDPWVGLMIEYKGFVGHFTFHEEESIFKGKVANIQDVVTFEGKTIEKVNLAFQVAVDEYIQWRERYGKEPEAFSKQH